VLLFPFYWMAITAVKPNERAARLQEQQPVLGEVADAGEHQQTALFRPTIRNGC
jgi:ABC-type glycerol-3-phosphate transport system permease component